MNFLGLRLRTTKEHSQYWKNRKIDWKKEYMLTWNHPHRYLISGILKSFDWVSLYEIGCGAGANIINIIKTIPGKVLGGCDISADAIELVKESFKGGRFNVCPADDVLMSDDSSDVVLTDMCLIYVSPLKIHKHIEEIKRIARNNVVLCEFHNESFWQRFLLRVRSGYNAYNYKKLLEKHGFYDIDIYKVPDEMWPGAKNDKFRFIIKAKVLK